MKTVNVRTLQLSIRRCIESSQTERIVVTRRGRPAALLVGVDGLDWEDVLLASSPAFWKAIAGRRQQKTAPIADVRRRLGIKSSSGASAGRR